MYTLLPVYHTHLWWIFFFFNFGVQTIKANDTHNIRIAHKHATPKRRWHDPLVFLQTYNMSTSIYTYVEYWKKIFNDISRRIAPISWNWFIRYFDGGTSKIGDFYFSGSTESCIIFFIILSFSVIVRNKKILIIRTVWKKKKKSKETWTSSAHSLLPRARFRGWPKGSPQSESPTWIGISFFFFKFSIKIKKKTE